ncbi:MAG: alcohol dehydrogenase catalytic domain-containing protein [Candidatus Latescibacterota bacterium]|jgi:threonine dehydrogenase-like Zn-dependent dehydrogenase
MKALVVTEGHQLELREVPPPQPGPYEALVRIKACGICSTTDRELIAGTQPYHRDYPCILGHEAIGEAVEIGARVRTFKPGDWVTRPVSIWPGARRDGLASGWGGFAEYGFVRDQRAMLADGDPSASGDYTAQRQNLVPRDGLDLGQAVLAISLAETASWFWHLPAVAGRSVCVAGTGIAGLSAALWARMAGARRVVVLGRRQERLDLACELVADAGVDVKEANAAQAVVEAGGRIELFVEAAGQSELFRLAAAVLRQGGTFARYAVKPREGYLLPDGGLPDDLRTMSPPAEEHLAYDWAAGLLRRNMIPAGKLLTHRWPLDEYAAAFREVAAGRVVKGMLTM